MRIPEIQDTWSRPKRALLCDHKFQRRVTREVPLPKEKVTLKMTFCENCGLQTSKAIEL